MLRPADFRPGASKTMTGCSTALLRSPSLCRDLDDDLDIVPSPVTIDEVETRLHQLCERLSKEARGLIEAWRVYMQRLDSIETREARKSMRMTRRIIEFNLDRLREFGCFTQIRQGNDQAWQSTRRYQVIVQQLASTALFDLVRGVLDQSSNEGTS
ncbi:MAG: hypothetical protein A4E57_04322 [Syntrophorhabdaceae bacterium PtaU1.Bin034]|nr:MAG: hypothetical protein A4E57_04322 [Syntrophorhabdaceae bacterium PtaU1.Bin034]